MSIKLFVTRTLLRKKLTMLQSLWWKWGLKSRQKRLSDLHLTQKYYFKWLQLIHAIPKSWKLPVLNDKKNCKNIIYLNHHLIRNSQISWIEKLIQKNCTFHILFWKILFIYCFENTLPTSPKYFSNIFANLQVEWKYIYLSPRKVSIDTNLRMFQYKMLNNILYLNK